MPAQLKLGDIVVNVAFKPIKNVHLSVHPPVGRVTISAPLHLSLDAIRAFTARKIGWIKRQQRILREQERETAREALDRETHYVWGRRLLLKVIEADAAPSVNINQKRLILRMRPGTNMAKRLAILDGWYREEVRRAALPLLDKWEAAMGVKARQLFIQRMKTKWGSCNPKAATIRINTDLAKKPRECLEYLVVHELTHLIEPTHNDRFRALMDKFMPKWQSARQTLNLLPVRHEAWNY